MSGRVNVKPIRRTLPAGDPRLYASCAITLPGRGDTRIVGQAKDKTHYESAKSFDTLLQGIYWIPLSFPLVSRLGIPDGSWEFHPVNLSPYWTCFVNSIMFGCSPRLAGDLLCHERSEANTAQLSK